MEKLEMLAYLIVRFGLMALVVAVGAAMLYPLVSRWKWLVGEDRDDEAFYASLRGDVAANIANRPKIDPTRSTFNCDSCDMNIPPQYRCEFRTYDEDGECQDYEICQGCYNEIMDSWA
jgi:hypothetical protein